MNVSHGFKRLFSPHSFFQTLLGVGCLCWILGACSTTPPNPPQPTDLNEVEVPQNFDFETTRQVSITLSTEDILGQPIAHSFFEIYHSYDLDSETPHDGTLVFTGMTDAEGRFENVLEVPGHINTLLVYLSYVGLPSSAEVEIGDDNIVDIHFAPVTADSFSSDISFDVGAKPAVEESALESQAFNFQYTYLGTYNNQGVPNYLSTPDLPSARLLQLVNNSLPERKPVPIYHPSFIANSAQANLTLTDNAEVWVTFLHEGAGYKNALGYYYYNVNTPPAYREAINNLTVIFPNSSFQGSGGGLHSGDRVQLKYKPGTAQESTEFPAGTVIGWFLVANGWNGSAVGNGYTIHLSNSNLNYERNPNLQKHTVLLYDSVEDAMILGFEDINRESSGCDNDFNDAIFKVKVSSINAVDLSEVVPADSGSATDTDSDGVNDIYDQYPNDPTKAFNNYYPSKTDYGTLAFEDQWPLKGDYDFNDLVIDYRVNQITNAQNKVVELQGSYLFRAAGAAYTNAFAFELPVLPTKVASVTGQWFAGSSDHSYQPASPWIYLDLNSNGTEKMQSKAVIFVVDDSAAFLGRLMNTEPEGALTAPKLRNITIRFTEPLELATLGQPPYNPFIVTNIYSALAPACDCQERGIEVHLPGYQPTSLADANLFNTGDDASNLASNSTYKTATNLPWALHIPSQFAYPKERTQIIRGHNYFVNWASSGGLYTKDWYLDKSGYRNINNLYDQSQLPSSVVVE